MSSLPFRLSLLTAPVDEPVSLAEAKLHASIDESASNASVAAMISAARKLAENYTRRVFITQTWKMFLDEWPCASFIELPKAPLQSVTHIKTYDDSDAATTLAASNYFVDTMTKPGRIVLRGTGSWPTVARVANGIEIQFVAGYATNPADVPAEIRQAILMMVTNMYEHRGETITGGGTSEAKDGAYELLSAHKDWTL